MGRDSIFFFFILLFLLLPATIARDYLAVVYHNCLHNVTNNSSLSSAFQQNLGLALRNLTNLSSSGTNYSITSSGSGIHQAYAMFQCRGDQTTKGCFDCVSNATTTLQTTCPSSIGALIQIEGCYLRYDNQTFFTLDTTFVIGFCYGSTTNSVVLQAIQSLMQNVTDLAPKNGGYAAESAAGESEYALAQCLGYLNESECSQCLTATSWNLPCSGSSLGEQYHMRSCYYRFEPYLFFNAPSPPPSGATPALPRSPPPASPTPASTTRKTEGWKIAIIIVGAVVGALFATVALFFTLVGRHKAKTRQDHAQDDAWTQPFFQPKAQIFTLHELEVATRDFHPDNKLGEGGFGPVYKGTLPNGLDVAVKKLSSRSQQGKREFLNEVNVITNVQHRNLIKLFGGCVEGPERILVYEYLPNKSVDALLFGDSMDGRTLDWPTRFGIVTGMARGLAYLHQDSQVRIIHRDIKPSNILLDDQLNPKIADFGLARLVSDEESHISTRVAGTLGYLAPEYAMHGELTEKADVFSYGVVALEVISGRRNTDIRPENQRLLEWAWRLYREQRHLDLVDPKLGTSFFAEEVIRAVHVALLCTQEVAVLRPSMSRVSMLLSGRSEILEIPTKPAFVEPSDLRGGRSGPVDSTVPVSPYTSIASSDSPTNPLNPVSQNAQSISDVEPR